MASEGHVDKETLPEYFQIAESPDVFDDLQLSPKEREILELCDYLDDLKVENAILRVRDQRRTSAVNANIGGKSLSEQADEARRELLKVKTAYSLRRKIIDHVLITDPCLKAVHSGASASLAERELLPRINRRDILSIAHTNICGFKSDLASASMAADAERMTVTATNRELSETLLSLTSELSPVKKEDIDDPNLRSQIDELEEKMRTNRSRWRIMKNVMSGIIVGSGIDWARNDQLRELVLDAEEDEV
ncbi:MAG: hypothetical protein M1814_003451 [Vezdaea aestivalis]|nr:MAG: hypothetical protein M1814_003451 [Vezdaea aestivalis]